MRYLLVFMCISMFSCAGEPPTQEEIAEADAHEETLSLGLRCDARDAAFVAAARRMNKDPNACVRVTFGPGTSNSYPGYLCGNVSIGLPYVASGRGFAQVSLYGSGFGSIKCQCDALYGAASCSQLLPYWGG